MGKVYGYIVEGVHDKDRVLEALGDVHVLVTEGTRINNRIHKELVNMMMEVDEVYILTDPDEAGDWLAEQLKENYPALNRIRLDAEKCKCHRNRKIKIGIEHADIDYLLNQIEEQRE